MGRTRDYDEETVLAGAMHAFRRRGYGGASIRDLEAATGLKAGSIYNSFGDKAGLFAAAFAHYNRTVLQGRLDRFASPKRGLGGLRKIFLSLLQEPGGGSFGCLITNSAVELGGHGKPHPSVKEGLRTLESAFVARLGAAREDGTLRTDADPAVTAMKLLALYQGILVLIRAGYAAAPLKQLINREFDALEDTR
jgi:TetR/AcrR family transcriptional repressor of nem operon